MLSIIRLSRKLWERPHSPSQFPSIKRLQTCHSAQYSSVGWQKPVSRYSEQRFCLRKLVRTPVVFPSRSLKRGRWDFRFCSFGHFWDDQGHFSVFVAKYFGFFGFLVHSGLWIFRFQPTLHLKLCLCAWQGIIITIITYLTRVNPSANAVVLGN